jgi:hypothetical protein
MGPFGPIPRLFLAGFYKRVVMGPDGFEPPIDRL